jgi:hydrogenase maturation protease
LIIGIGNRDRGDDAVGRHIAHLLNGMEHDGEATSLLAAFQGAERVWVIDAASSGAPPGTIHRIDCTTDTVPARSPTSSHGFGIAAAIELARALGTLPPHCVLYAIEAATFTPGAPLSPAVTRAARDVAERIRAERATPPPRATRRRRHPAPATDRR